MFKTYFLFSLVLSDPIRRSVYDAVRANPSVAQTRELSERAEHALVEYGRPVLATELDRLFARLERDDLEHRILQATRPQVLHILVFNWRLVKESLELLLQK